MRDAKPVGMGPVLAHQQPSSQAWADFVKSQAGGRGGQLLHQHPGVAAQFVAQCRALRQLALERAGADAPGRARPLHECVQWRDPHAHRELHAEHAFAAHHADLQGGLVVDLGQQRDEAVDRKIHISRSFSGLAQHLGEDEVDRLAQGEQAQAFLAWKELDEVVLGVGNGLSPGVADAKAEGGASLTAT